MVKIENHIKAVKTMSACAMSIQAAAFFIERFIMVGKPQQTDKQWLKNALKATEKAMGVFSSLGFMKIEEARKLANGYWEAGTIAYQLFMHLSMLPPSRTDEYMELVEQVARPIIEQADIAEKKYAEDNDIFKRIDLGGELKHRGFKSTDGTIYKKDAIRINLLLTTMEIFNGKDRVFLGKWPQSEYQLDMVLKLVV